ncbi:MAG TPA: lytic transglycosylase domain-containing protein [Chloroflexota bacterium]|nr:lytic transglycosylase domain-containing protein [Chloroflexota bacterium]
MSFWKKLRTRAGVRAGVATFLGLAMLGQFGVAVPQAFAASDAAPRASTAVQQAATGSAVYMSTMASSGLGSAVPASVSQWGGSIVSTSNAYGVDPNLVAAIIRTESGGDPSAGNPSGAVGLMQVLGGSYDPDTNIRQGVALYSQYLAEFNGNTKLALAAYNAGDGAVRTYGGIPPYPETQNYVDNVMNRYYLYSGS